METAAREGEDNTLPWGGCNGPITLATLAVSLLVTLFQRLEGHLAERVGQDLGDAAISRLDRPCEVARSRLASDRIVEGVLQRVREQPNSDRDHDALHIALVQAVEADPAFDEVLAKLIEEANEADGPYLTQLSRAGRRRSAETSACRAGTSRAVTSLSALVSRPIPMVSGQRRRCRSWIMWGRRLGTPVVTT